MRFKWSRDRGPMNGAFVFLSASVPNPKREQRFLRDPEGVAGKGVMLRVIDRRVDDAVKSLVAKTLEAGGQIVHGGHPSILGSIAQQARNWLPPEGEDPPIRIYQSEHFRDLPPIPGRGQMERAGTAIVKWVSENLAEVVKPWDLPEAKIREWLPQQAPDDPKEPEKTARRREGLLALRLTMLIETQPVSAVCIGGMEGIEAEARLYLDLAAMGKIPYADRVHALGSTYGATAQLPAELVHLVDMEHWQSEARPSGVRFLGGAPEAAPGASGPAGAAFQSTPETAHKDLRARVSYDDVMRGLVKRMAAARA